MESRCPAALHANATELLAVVVGRVDPALAIRIAPASVARTGLVALGVGVAGAMLPIRRVLRTDPAVSFRRPT